MADLEQCRQAILSEDYRDFIGNGVRTPVFDRIVDDSICRQEAGYGYRCFYLPSQTAEPVTLARFSYNSIPKCYTPTSIETLNQTGILPVQNYPTLRLSGRGVLIGFLDSGIDYTLNVFRRLDGSTRIVGIWDQTVQTGVPPEGFSYGSEYTGEMIDAALSSDSPLSLVPVSDETGHGTYVASLACGRGVPEEQFLGAAPESSIAVVKLKQAKNYLRQYYFIPESTVCYQETDLMLGLKYLNDLADFMGMPLVVCVTVGSNMGGHTATLPLPSLLDSYGARANHIHVTGVGNEADKRHHFFGRIESDTDRKTAEIRVGENISGFFLELWTKIPDILAISIISPSGEDTGPIPFRTGGSTQLDFLLERTKAFVDYRLIVEKTTSELIFFRFQAPAAGIWRIVVESRSLIDGEFHMWLPQTELLSGEIFFLEPDPYTTLTNPSSATYPIVTAYYDGGTGAVSQSSGRGYPRNGASLPDIAAPGVRIKGAQPGERFLTMTGASGACAITAGAIALMLEWLIYYENVTGIDSMQIKSLLILGAVRPDVFTYPNREWGYGQLNLYNTFETMRQL